MFAQTQLQQGSCIFTIFVFVVGPVVFAGGPVVFVGGGYIRDLCREQQV